MEQESKEPAGITRGQNVLYVLPRDWSAAPQFLDSAIDRIDAGKAETQLVVITSDADAAEALAVQAARSAGDREIAVVGVTTARRASRRLKAGGAHVVIGAPDDLLSLMREAALKLDSVKSVVLAWADELVDRGGTEPLEQVMTEMPKEGARIIVTSVVTAEVEALVERYARRARREGLGVEPEGAPTVPVEVVATSGGGRAASLRRLLDQVDPETAFVYARTELSQSEVRDTLRALGHGATGSVTSGADAPSNVALVVLYDLPSTVAQLQAIAGARGTRVVALAQPRQVPALRVLGAAPVTPLSLTDASTKARRTEAALLDSLRETLAHGGLSREVLALEPLLDSHDALEIAAAALKMLEDAKRSVTAASAGLAARAGGAGAAPDQGMTKLFISIGSRDEVRPGDLVGALANEGGISSAKIGRVEIRESHTLVDVASDVAEEVASKVNGISIRGRRIVARVDQGRDRPERGAGGPRGDRPDRGGPRAPRGDRPDRGPRGDKPFGGGKGGPRGGAGGGSRGGFSRDAGSRPPRPRRED